MAAILGHEWFPVCDALMLTHKENPMSSPNNFFHRAAKAIIASRERSARRTLERLGIEVAPPKAVGGES